MEENLAIKEIFDIIDSITPEQHDILKKIKCGIFMNHKVPFSETDRNFLSTREGIQKQLDGFIQPQGLIYYIKFDGNVPSVQKRAISIQQRKGEVNE